MCSARVQVKMIFFSLKGKCVLGSCSFSKWTMNKNRSYNSIKRKRERKQRMMDKEPSTLSIHQKWKKEREKKKGGKWRRQHGQKKEPIKGSNFIFLFLWLQEKKKKKRRKKGKKEKRGIILFCKLQVKPLWRSTLLCHSWMEGRWYLAPMYS